MSSCVQAIDDKGCASASASGYHIQSSLMQPESCFQGSNLCASMETRGRMRQTSGTCCLIRRSTISESPMEPTSIQQPSSLWVSISTFYADCGPPKSEVKYEPKAKPQEKIGTWRYKTLMCASGDNDDRVSSFHSYKFAAALQHTLAQYWGSQQRNPILLAVQEHIGHAGEPFRFDMFLAYMHFQTGV